ncbi:MULTISPECIES: response regulator [Leptolyngbya]|jgi:DNA-binding response OmpR family regulator|uniref:Multi-component transcriptional regulator, winged helix family protein n=2 Tax=Leptolyngbya boryana TaxID=1184 RepID=A0A1Z4JDT7_LEPBY|nr:MULTISPECIES: response regulator [Leptolyngbya]BAY54955.1 multi-component transcriptional regulator, winged helix family protein [Leptolyngbya boryana NIES-2135]MBD2365934.1 response regulator [Leptolyngbya sp. FACHB-161]MBD2372114.1 response regulator [Leptolyngbya sp. FACHB-238]MBD2396538.1 response regulator [Leptolyngbya sp. FACHB-239]MBD2403060.1 response regulator [Leptolyngbya sp. FACHB-402]
MRFLLIEHDSILASQLSELLIAQRYSVNLTEDSQTALQLLETYGYDLVILDTTRLMWDAESDLSWNKALEFCRNLRLQGHQMPIMILSETDVTADRIAALEAGADDFVTQPIDLHELLVRVRTLLRRGKETVEEVLTWENLRFNCSTGEVTYHTQILHLTPKEYRLLELFLRNPSKVFSRSALLDRIWNPGEFPSEQAVNTQIKGLRQKLKAVGIQSEVIESLYGLGYRLKPAPTRETEVFDAIAQIWQQFQPKLQEYFAVFEQALTHPSSEVQKQARMFAHQLVGSLGTFGFAEGSTIARQLEQGFRSEPLDHNLISERIEALKAVLKHKPESRKLSEQPAQQFPSGTRVLLIDDDMTLTAQMQVVLSANGIQVESASDSATARMMLAHNPPQLILLDLMLPDEDGFKLLEDLNAEFSSIPVLIMTSRDQLSDRVAVARLGGRAFLQKPVAPEQLFQAMMQVLEVQQHSDYQVLIVDDDPQICSIVRTLLEPWGVRVTALSDPRSFWAVLEHSAPDLLILDIEMPNFSGLELAQVVRNDMRWSGLPILFLSAHRDTETVRQVFTVGADDYVSKPIVDAELIARVLNRLERSPVRRRKV